MINIALINFRYQVDINFQAKESLGLAYLAAMLRNEGHKVTVFDCQAHNLGVKALMSELDDQVFDLIGLSMYLETMPSLVKFLELLSPENFAHICCGGQYASFEAENLVRNFSRIDSVVIGEGEMTLCELARCLPGGTWRGVNGICYMENGEVKITPSRRLIENLDQLPYPHREFPGQKEGPDREATIAASRGCYAKCEFCSIVSFFRFQKGKAMRIRSPEKVVDEIEYLVQEKGVRRFFFADDNFMIAGMIRKGWVKEFVDEILRRALAIEFDLDCRVDDLDTEALVYLKQAGLRGVFLGVESFVQRQLDLMNKRVKVEENFKAIELLNRHRVVVWMGFIMFDPFTTSEEIRTNVAGLDRIQYFRRYNYSRPLSHELVASKLIPYSGTPIVNTLMEKCPELMTRTKFGYDYRFANETTARFFETLERWRPTSKEMIRSDTLWVISEAIKRDKNGVVAELHGLSRKYMKLDRETFLELLNIVERGENEVIDDYLDAQRRKWQIIANRISILTAFVKEGSTRSLKQYNTAV